jgi:hypothetical protein
VIELRAPFPWAGGKSKCADVVWRGLGHDVVNYVEPFAGSLAVLLGRPNGPGKIASGRLSMETTPSYVSCSRGILRSTRRTCLRRGLCIRWKGARGYAGEDNDNREQESLWFSKYCLPIDQQRTLFG